jgi:hypothetical protein
VPHLELNLAPTAKDMPEMALALMRAIIAAADQDQDEMTVLLIHGEPKAVIALYGLLGGGRARRPRSRLTRRRRLKYAWCLRTRGAGASA